MPLKDLSVLVSYLGAFTMRIPIVFAGLFVVVAGKGVGWPWGPAIAIGGIAVSIGQAWIGYYRHPESPRSHGQRS